MKIEFCQVLYKTVCIWYACIIQYGQWAVVETQQLTVGQ